jgi:hypothetical protein
MNNGKGLKAWAQNLSPETLEHTFSENADIAKALLGLKKP